MSSLTKCLVHLHKCISVCQTFPELFLVVMMSGGFILDQFLSARQGLGLGNYQFPDELINISVHLPGMTPAHSNLHLVYHNISHNESKAEI